MAEDAVEQVPTDMVIPNMVPDQIISGAIHERAVAVKEELEALKVGIEGGFIDMCFLINEARDGEYHKVWGYERFDSWVENGSGLEIAARQAYYFANIAKKSIQLGLTKKELKEIRSSSKLKEIFSLDSASDIKGLLEAAKSESLADIKKKVSGIKNPSTTTSSFMTLKLDVDVRECVEDAINLARLNYGDTMSNGITNDIGISKCMELICTAYLQDPNNFPEGHSPMPAPSLLS